MEPVHATIIYYSVTGTVQTLANAAADGAEKAGAQVRLRRVPEPARNDDVAEADLDDLDWADVVLLGTPTRFGTPAAPLMAFIGTTGRLWKSGGLAGKVYSAFTSTSTLHGGHESTILALSNVFYHWGGVIVPPGYTDPIQYESGNPYGTSHATSAGPPDDVALEAARYQARRAVDTAAALTRGRLTNGAHR